MDARESEARKMARRAHEKLNDRLFTKEANRRWYRSCMEREDPKRLVELAYAGNPDALELVIEYTKGAHRAGLKVPMELHEFAWEYLWCRGKLPAPPGLVPWIPAYATQRLGN
jgi:hypothetical protein